LAITTRIVYKKGLAITTRIVYKKGLAITTRIVYKKGLEIGKIRFLGSHFLGGREILSNNQ
jgi:hypothetical protein